MSKPPSNKNESTSYGAKDGKSQPAVHAEEKNNTITNYCKYGGYHKHKISWPSKITAVCTIAIAIITGFYTHYAAKQAAQMEKAINIASDTAIRQLRAYVMVNRVGIESVISNSRPTVTVEFKNSGQTPAYDVLGWVSIGLAKFPLTYSIPGEINFPAIKGSKDVITNGGTTLLPATMEHTLTSEEVEQLNTGSHAIYFIGKISYKDAFGIERFTKFKFFCNKIPGGSLSHASIYTDGNEAD
jgi:hypothetical protein